MKREKPDPKRPQLWFQPGRLADESLYWESERVFMGSRLRIFYPDGKAIWQSCFARDYSFEEGHTPCWIFDVSEATSIAELRRMANEYDRRNGFPPMEFVCSL